MRRLIVLVPVIVIASVVVGLGIARFFGSTREAQSVDFVPPTFVPTSEVMASATIEATLEATAEATTPPAATAEAPTAPAATSVSTATPGATPRATARPAATTAATAPAATTTAAATPTSLIADDYLQYTVKPGDSLKNIADSYNVTVSDILAVNTIANPDSLTVGDVLWIPQHSSREE